MLLALAVFRGERLRQDGVSRLQALAIGVVTKILTDRFHLLQMVVPAERQHHLAEPWERLGQIACRKANASNLKHGTWNLELVFASRPRV